MSKLVAVVLSLAVGFALARFAVPPALDVVDVNAVPTASTNIFASDQPLDERVRALEQAVSDERQARQLLQEEVIMLTLELERQGRDVIEDETVAPAATTSDDSRAARREAYRRRNSPEGRLQLLLDAGFQPAQAQSIVRRESELQMQTLQARYDAQRDGTPFDYSQSRFSSDSTLRAELGDADYERYLEATGRSTSISVSNVIESSPAQRAGLQIGDEIVRYDGERVFSMSDLSRQTMQGDPGASIVVDIVRDGIPMQVVVPRGPVGISAGRRFSR